MTTLNVTLQSFLTIVEEFSAAEIPSGGNRTITHNQFDTTQRLSASSTPPATKKFADTLTGSQSLDLTALADPLVGTIDGTGLKVQAILVNNLSAANTVDVDDGASNAYQLNNADAYRIEPGGTLLCFFNDTLDDIDATHKAIDITATAGQTYEIMILMG